ncbi:MAG TPA: hypothetical protein VJ484_07545 [Lysobacter sp.]|nr:hypothetical protein [Lysobacter sp.]
MATIPRFVGRVKGVAVLLSFVAVGIEETKSHGDGFPDRGLLLLLLLVQTKPALRTRSRQALRPHCCAKGTVETARATAKIAACWDGVSAQT